MFLEGGVGTMSKLVNPHGKAKKLKPLLLSGEALAEEKKKAKTLKKIPVTSRESGDLIMLGIGAFTPLTGFMNEEDWKGVCKDMKLKDGTFWPIPITLSASKEDADAIKIGQEITLVDEETKMTMATMKVTKKYTIDKKYECQEVFKTTDPEHPGVAKVMEQREINLAGPVNVLSEGTFPKEFKGIYQRPAEARAMFEKKGWKTVAALQLRNPMHRSHEYLAKIALETLDGLYIHQLLGKLKPGDIPAEVRVKAIEVLVENYFVKDTCIQGGYPLEMRYAGPREALLHALFRQNYGCSHLIVGRDHAGVGSYYGPFDAQAIFDKIPKDALKIGIYRGDNTVWCHKCNKIVMVRDCPHTTEDHLNLSGTKVREMLSRGEAPPPEFSRPEVAKVLSDYYQSDRAK
jgi:sulfate adenylyltransferase